MTAAPESLYARFVDLANLGRKAEAKQALREFLDTFHTLEDRAVWTASHLPGLAIDRRDRIRHELYAEVIFPVLHAGYTAGDTDSLFWLAQTIQSLYSAPSLYAQIDQRAPEDLLKQAHATDPSRRDIREALLETLLEGFTYLDHEWPAGILLPIDASPDVWDELLDDIALARKLDEPGHCAARLRQFEARVRRHHPGRASLSKVRALDVRGRS